MATSSRVLYSDVNPEVNVVDSSELVYDASSINASILTILETRRGTRVFRRNFGSDIMDLLFLPMTEGTKLRIYRELIRSLEEWEPRIVIELAEVIPDFPNQQWFIEITYRIPTLGDKTAVFNFNLVQGK